MPHAHSGINMAGLLGRGRDGGLQDQDNNLSEEHEMKQDAIVLDEHRGMAAQQATEIRRRLAEVEADQAALRGRRTELERYLLAAPASTWLEAAEKARYLLGLLATTSIAQDPRRRKLIAGVLDDFSRLSGGPAVEAMHGSESDIGTEVGQ